MTSFRNISISSSTDILLFYRNLPLRLISLISKLSHLKEAMKLVRRAPNVGSTDTQSGAV